MMILMTLSLVGCGAVESEMKVEWQSEEKHEVKNEEQTVVYSFTGENEGLSLDNGVIVLSSTQQSLYAGNLQNNQEDVSDVLNYSVDFFILSDEGKEHLFTYETGDFTEEDEMLTKEKVIVPGITSEEIFTTNVQDNIENNFYVEVTMTKTNGDKQTHQIKLDATKVGININQD